MSFRMPLIAALCLVLGLALVARAEEETKEQKIEAKDVPAKVMEAFKKDHSGVTVEKYVKETYPDGTVHYEFEFKDAEGKKHEVEYNTDGEKLEEHDEEHDHAHDH